MVVACALFLPRKAPDGGGATRHRIARSLRLAALRAQASGRGPRHVSSERSWGQPPSLAGCGDEHGGEWWNGEEKLSIARFGATSGFIGPVSPGEYLLAFDCLMSIPV